MKLLVNTNNADFIQYLIYILKSKIKSIYPYYYNDTLNNLLLFITNNRYSLQKIVNISINNIVTYRYNDSSIITIDNNTVLPNTDFKLIDICKLINYGSLDISGTMIYTKSFKYIDDNINDLYRQFSYGGI